MSTLDTSRPFTRRQALASGIRVATLEGPRFRRLHDGIYIRADVRVTALDRARAALLPFRADAVASHATAARVYAVPVELDPDDHVTVGAAAARRTRAKLTCHVGSIDASVLMNGVRVSTPEKVFLELAPHVSLVDLVVAGDHLVRRGHTRPSKLVAFTASCTGRGARRARVAALLVRERVDSPMETRLRLLLVLAGLPEPVVNTTWSGDGGVTFRRFDLCWPAVRLIVEYDGRHHAEVVAQWESDLNRREQLDDANWRIVVVTAAGIYKTPATTVAKVHRLLRERGLAGTPQRTSDEWRRHFAGPP